MRAIANPLSPWVYFKRNLSRTLPIAFVIVIAVTLVASVVTVIDSINLTVLTMYGYNRDFTVITPRNSMAVAGDIENAIRKEKLVGRIYSVVPAFTVVKTIFGKMPFAVLGMSEAGALDAVRTCGLHLAAGRLPRHGKAEVTMSAEIARNRQLQLGDVVLEPKSEDSYSSVPMKLVGTLSGPVWLALTSDTFMDAHFPVAPHGFITMAPEPSKQRRLDAALEKLVDKSRARVWTYRGLVAETTDALSSLYLIMGLVVGIVVFSIAFLTGMLTSIYFTQRQPEFATLAAIGYSRRTLLLRVLGETAIFCALGWIVGTIATMGLLTVLKQTMLFRRGLLLDVFDLNAFRFTLPLPASITLFALAAIGHRLKTLDPVSIIERRQ